MTKKNIRVVVAVIEDEAGNILISKRQQGQHLAGLWEFPGGKVEAEESLESALARELQEELALRYESSKPLCSITHDYLEKSVTLEVFVVSKIKNTAMGMEGQEIRWVTKEALADYEFPEANKAILEKVTGV